MSIHIHFMVWSFMVYFSHVVLKQCHFPTKFHSSLLQFRMSVMPDLASYGNSEMAENVTSCQEWEKAHHLLFHLGNLSLVVGLLIPTTVGLHMIFLRLLLMTGQFERTLLATTYTHLAWLFPCCSLTDVAGADYICCVQSYFLPH